MEVMDASIDDSVQRRWGIIVELCVDRACICSAIMVLTPTTLNILETPMEAYNMRCNRKGADVRTSRG